MSQFFYIHPDNPQARLINQAVEIVRKGGVIVYPTAPATPWAAKLKTRARWSGSAVSVSCRTATTFPDVPRFVRAVNLRFCRQRGVSSDEKQHAGQLHLYPQGDQRSAARLLQEKRKTIGMRVPSNPIAQALLETLGEPMLSTSLMLPGSDFTESDPEEIKDRLEKVVDLIIHGGFLGQQPTTVIDLTEDTPVVLREGVGDVKPFL
mgnify:CR=1 FL=1